ncbi:MAG TPA: thermonuclease family protein [Pseudolabrys sp.]|nr:thermonuclease family protein [Pseudolabrys sp.]
MSTLLSRAVLVVAALALASEAAAEVCRLPDFGTATVGGIHDGRTLLLADGRELRLAAIEADETGRAALQELAGGKTLRLETLGPGVDRYGRVVAFAYAGNAREPLQQLMLEQGYARVSARVGPKPCADRLLAAEAAARAARRGIWANPNFAPLPSQSAERISSALGQFALVEGKVLSVRESGATIYLNFGLRWTRDFSVTVPKKRLREFATAGMDPKDLVGRKVRVRGWVEVRHGPVIQALAPEQIELAD